MDEGTRHRDPLTLSAGELVGELVALVREAQLGEQLEAAGVPLGIGAVQGELQADVLDRGEEGQQVVGLEDEPELGPAQAGPLVTRHARDLLSADQHAAGGRRLEATDQAEQGRLPATTRTGDGEAGAGLHVEPDPVDRADDTGGRRVVLDDRIEGES